MYVEQGYIYSWVKPSRWIKKLARRFLKKKQRDALADWLNERDWLMSFESWFENRHKRKLVVRIDEWDSWDCAHSLAIIAAPLLKQLQATQPGAPFTDDEDAPPEFASTAPPINPDAVHGSCDPNHHPRWEWILGEIVFAMECLAQPGDEWENRFYDFDKSYGDPGFCDREGLKKVNERVNNGCRLFGKYFRALWD